MAAIGTKKAPVHPAAATAFVLAVVAVGLALYGAFVGQVAIPGTPLNAARGGPGADAPRRYALEGAAFVLPLVVGVGAAVLGGYGMRRIEAAGGTYRGDAVAVFAVFVGGLSAVIGGCMLVAVYGWRSVPTLYTS